MPPTPSPYTVHHRRPSPEHPITRRPRRFPAIAGALAVACILTGVEIAGCRGTSPTASAILGGGEGAHPVFVEKDHQRAAVETPAFASATSTRGETAGTDGDTQPAGEAEPPIALVNGRPIRWDEARPLLAEAAGGLVLEELVLDRLLEARTGSRGMAVTDDALDAEQRILLASLDPDRQQAARLLGELRRRRGLGDRRFNLLLRRNAMLRALVRDEVEVNEALIRAEYERRHGPKYQVRIITGDTVTDLKRVVERLRSGEPFGDVAVKLSTDLSADRGGLLEPISPADERYPRAVRDVLADLELGSLSPILALDAQFAVVQMVDRLPDQYADASMDSVREAIRIDVRRTLERIRMEGLVRELLREAEVLVMDRDVKLSWDRHRQTGP